MYILPLLPTENVKPKVVLKSGHLWITDIVAYTNSESDVKTSATVMMDSLQNLVHSCGEDWSMNNLVVIYLYVQNMTNFAHINSVYKTYFGMNPAARLVVHSLYV